MVLIRLKNIEEYSVYPTINETILLFDIREILYVTSFHTIINNPYNPPKEIISTIYIIANYHFTILKIW